MGFIEKETFEQTLEGSERGAIEECSSQWKCQCEGPHWLLEETARSSV